MFIVIFTSGCFGVCVFHMSGNSVIYSAFNVWEVANTFIYPVMHESCVM